MYLLAMHAVKGSPRGRSNDNQNIKITEIRYLLLMNLQNEQGFERYDVVGFASFTFQHLSGLVRVWGTCAKIGWDKPHEECGTFTCVTMVWYCVPNE